MLYVVTFISMEPNVLASKALAQVCILSQHGSASHQYPMDMVLEEGNVFHCKLSTHAHSIDIANKIKRTSVYLFLDASHVQSLTVCDNEEEAIPSCVKSAFIKQASSTSSDDIVSIRFVLKGHAPLVTPDSRLQKRPSLFKDIEALLRIGQSETFNVYVPSNTISREHLPGLCNALARGALKPAPEGVIKSLYTRPTKSKIVTRLDELWNANEPDGPPPYSPTAPGASDDEPSSQSDSRDTCNYRRRGKRRTASPVSRQTSPKRQLLTEKSAPERWELAFAALSAEFATLREQLQQLQRAPGVDAGTQTDPLVEHGPASCSVSHPQYSSPSQASTVENTIEDRLLMVEDSILDEQNQRVMLDAKLDHENKQVRIQNLLR